jgi:hypothetical protein
MAEPAEPTRPLHSYTGLDVIRWLANPPPEDWRAAIRAAIENCDPDALTDLMGRLGAAAALPGSTVSGDEVLAYSDALVAAADHDVARYWTGTCDCLIPHLN